MITPRKLVEGRLNNAGQDFCELLKIRITGYIIAEGTFRNTNLLEKTVEFFAQHVLRDHMYFCRIHN